MPARSKAGDADHIKLERGPRRRGARAPVSPAGRREIQASDEFSRSRTVHSYHTHNARLFDQPSSADSKMCVRIVFTSCH